MGFERGGVTAFDVRDLNTCRMELVCVLGATGFIGRHAVLVLLENGFRVRAAVRRAAAAADLKALGAEVVEADVTRPETLTRAIDGCSFVVNATGIYRWWVPDPSVFKQVNEDGARHVAEACLSQVLPPRLVHISTAMAYGYPAEPRPFTEEAKAGPHAAAYPASKYAGDEAVMRASAEHDLPVVALYLGCVTGAGDPFSTGRPAAVYRDFMLGKIPVLVAPDTKYVYVAIQDVQQVRCDPAAVCRASAPTEQLVCDEESNENESLTPPLARMRVRALRSR